VIVVEQNGEKEEYLARGAEIQRNIVKLLSDSLKIPVYSIEPKLMENVYDAIIEEVPELKSIFTEDELRREVSNFMSKVVAFHTKGEELGERITEFIEDLKQEKEYEAILLLNGLIDLPIGTKLGVMEIIEKDESRKELMDHIKYVEDKGLIYPQNCSWAKLVFKSYRTIDLSEILYKMLSLPYSILSLIMHMNMDVGDTVGAIYSQKGNIWFLGRIFGPSVGWSKYRADIFGKYLDLLSSISQNKKPTRLEEKIIQAIQVFWLSRLSQRTEIRFLILISAFESLLLTDNDRDYLGLKLAEKTTFLMEEEKDKRNKLFKLMKKYYSKRSDLVHKGENTITDADERKAENIFKNLVFKMLDLTGSYEKMEQKSHDRDKEGVEDYIDSLKFA